MASNTTHTHYPQCTSPRPDLHSFPTRRSSDLASLSSIDPRSRSTSHSRSSTSWRYGASTRSSSVSTPPRPACPTSRSEEHTSELQSRRDLVCRLLLENNRE